MLRAIFYPVGIGTYLLQREKRHFEANFTDAKVRPILLFSEHHLFKYSQHLMRFTLS